MFLDAKDLILKDKAQLYNNVAEVNGVQGRLLAELEIWPRGRLTYDFQVLGEHCQNSALPLSHAFEQTPFPPIYGHFLTIDEPDSGGMRWSEGPSSAIYGNTAKAAFGKSTDDSHTFDFYLPNTHFQRIRANQELIITETKVQGTNRQIAENSSGYYLEVPLGGTWSISLMIREDAQSWLDTKNRNIGTRITTRGRLFQHEFSFRNLPSFSSLKS